jgi:hypothetical protein
MLVNNRESILMTSRYDFMTASSVTDNNEDVFPDVASLNYADGLFTRIPTYYRMSEPELLKFWLYMWDTYGRAEMDDVLLNINGIPYLGALQPGSVLFNVDVADLDGYLKNKRPEADID